MTDSTHQLQIEVLAKDFAGKTLDRIGTKGEDVQKRLTKGAKAAGKETDKATKSLFEFGETGKKVSGFAGTAFASMGASVSLATANMDSLAGSSAAAAGSIAAGFGSGGPVGGAIAVASAAVGALIFAFRQSGEEAKKAAEDAAKALEPLSAQAKSVAESIESIADATAFERRIAEAKLAGTLTEAGEEVFRVKARFVEMRQEAVKTLDEAIIKVNELGRALGDDDLDDDVREGLVKTYDEAVKNVERLRMGLGTLNEARRNELATLEALREVESKRAEQSRLEQDRKEAEGRASAYRDQMQALREQVGLRVRLASLDEASRAVDADRGFVMELRLKGLNKEADALEVLVNQEETRLRLAKRQREEERARLKAKQAEQRIRNDSFVIKMLAARTAADKLAVQHAKERADFVGTEAERTSMLLRQRAEVLDLARQAKEEAIKEAEERQKSAEAYVNGLKQGNELLRAQIAGREREFALVQQLTEAAKEGGRAGVEALKEQLRLQAQVTAEKQKQAKAKESEKNFQSNLDRLINGGTMDKGLARRRNERRARNRLRKYRRAGQLDADGNYKGGGIRNAPGGGAIWAGGDADGLGAPTQMTQGSGDMGVGPNGTGKTKAQVAAESKEKAAAEQAAGLENLDGLGDAAIKGAGLDKVVTGLKDAAQKVAEQYKSALEALKVQEAFTNQIKDKTAEQVKLLEEGAKKAEEINDAIAEANKEREEITAAQKETVEAAKEAVSNLKEMRAAVEELQAVVRQMQEAAALKGGN